MAMNLSRKVSLPTLSSESMDVCRSDFPVDFIFGVATSACQVEGAAEEGGRGPSIWDEFTHVNKGKNIKDAGNGDVAVDQYHRYKEDVDLISKLGFDAYRFSISWSRIFPDGFGKAINRKGVAYYNNLIDALLEKGIQPFVTLYHLDLPLLIQQKMDGWLDKDIIEHFAFYAETCFAEFGDRVKHWVTINEPFQTAVNGYGTGKHAPGRCSDRNWSSEGNSSIEPCLVAHNQLLAHAKAVDVYRRKFKSSQGGVIGLVLDCEWAEPLTNEPVDKAAASRHLDFMLGWFLDPIYFGHYPETMTQKLGNRLPNFTEDEINMLRHSLDFVGLNHYTTRYVLSSSKRTEVNGFCNEEDLETIAEWEGEAIGDRAASRWLYIVPWGHQKMLNYITWRYGRPPIYVTENGMDDQETDSSSKEEFLNDCKRLGYFKGYIASVANSIRDGSDVRGYFAWSLLDNFEWRQGYTKRFGLVYVDYRNGLSRHPKSSALWFSDFLKGNKEINSNQM